MVVPTYPEGGSHALQVCQHHHQGLCLVRVGRFLSGSCQRLKEHVARDCSGRFGWNLHGKTARSALYLTVKVAGGGARPSTRARCSFAQNRVMGTNSTKPRIHIDALAMAYYR
jgi:hypothetical protein